MTLTLKEVVIDIIIPLFAGLIGGGISGSIIVKSSMKKKTVMKNRDTIYANEGDVFNGDKR